MFSPDRYVAALRFAAERHARQTVPGTDLPYLVHLASVAAEVIAALPGAGLDGDLAISCALLHDVLEDTAEGEARVALGEDVGQRFGTAVAAGIWALTKDDALPKPAQMPDSLRRIQAQPREVWCVKLADRITNLAPPPASWTAQKRAAYRDEARTIAEALGAASPALHQRITQKIAGYGA